MMNRKLEKKQQALEILKLNYGTDISIGILYELMKNNGYVWNQETVQWIKEVDEKNKLYAVSVKIDYQLYKLLRAKAKDLDISLSELTRRSFENYLITDGGDSTPLESFKKKV